MKKTIVLPVALLLVSVVFLCGCTDNQTEVIVSTKPPVNINMFSSANEGELIRFYFILEDVDGVNTVSNGHVQIEIFDDSDRSLYYNEFNVKSSEYIDYEYKLTGTPMGKAYEWRVSITDIEKGISLLGFGKAVLTFITPTDTSLSAEDTLVQIPTYTEEELEEIQEELYDENAVAINEKISKGNFEITVNEAGFFDKYELASINQYFRVDMTVKNIGSESDYFVPDGLVIIEGESQYDYTYSGTLDAASTIYPGITASGYLLFESPSSNADSVKLMFELGYDENFDPYLFEYTLNIGV